MSDFATEFMKSMGPQVSTQLAGTLGIKKQTASQLIPSVLPLIMGGLKRQMDTQRGAERANHILNKYGSPSVLDDVAGLLLQGGGGRCRGRLAGRVGPTDKAGALSDA